MSKKKFEQGGTYSAIGRAFQRDAEILRQKEQQQAAQFKDAPKAVEVKEPPKQEAGGPEPVQEVVPKAPPTSEPRKVPRSRTAIPVSSKRSPRKQPKEAVGELEEVPEPKARRSTRAGGRLPAVRVECLPEEFADVEQLVFNLGRAAGHKLSTNIVGRALLRLALEAEDEIRKAVERNPPRRRPANGDSEEMARHEDEWQQVIAEAMRTLRVKR